MLRVWLLSLGLLAGTDPVEVGQADRAPAPQERRPGAAPGAPASPDVERADLRLPPPNPTAGQNPPGDVAVIADHLPVFAHPDEDAFDTGELKRGDRVRVRSRAAGGWAEIDPPSSTIGWIDRGSLELGDGAAEPGGHRLDPAHPGSGPPTRARVVVPRAVLRSGRLSARMPGPPWVELPRGTMVRLVDRPPLTIGKGPSATQWYAVVPTPEASCYVLADALEEPPRREGVSERLAAYLVPDDGDPKAARPAAGAPPTPVAAEIARIDAAHRAILTSQAIDRWHFESIRADYQAILKRSGDNPAVEEALRERLARVTRHEQAAAAAREFQQVLAQSRRRDDQVAWLQKRLAAADRYQTITYHGIGFVQPSSRILDGRKLHVLINQQGQTIAYLDIPPGLDVQSIGTKRVGVRGAVHYNQELGTRIITVRDVEPFTARR